MSGHPKPRTRKRGYELRVSASRWRRSWRISMDGSEDVVDLAKLVAKGEPDKWVDVIDDDGRIICRFEPRSCAETSDQMTLGEAS